MDPELDAGSAPDAAPGRGLQAHRARTGRPASVGVPGPIAPPPTGPAATSPGPGAPRPTVPPPAVPPPAAPLPTVPPPVAQVPVAPAAGGSREARAGRGRLVVAVALVDARRRVLAARRTSPPAYAGMWEFPGGKVEPGEDELAALERECREELDVEIEAGPVLGQVELASPGWRLCVWFGRIRSGMPRAVEGGELRWLSVAQLDDVSWLPADLPLVEALRHRLSDPEPLPFPAG